MYNRYLEQFKPDEPKVKLDTDTLILIAIIWFILQENGETQIDTELLVVLGILLFMGL